MAKNSQVLGAFAVGAVVVVLAVLGTMWATGNLGAASTVAPGTGGTGTGGGSSLAGACPDDGDTSLKLDVANVLNDTAAETFDVVGYLYSDGGDFQSVSDTTAGTATINCGETYTMAIVRADANNGDNSRLEKVINGAGATIEGGVVKFQPLQSTYSLRLGARQHGTLEFRARDVDAGQNVYDSSDAITTDFEGDGVLFESVTSNTSAIAVGAGGSLHYEIEARSSGIDTDFNDYYTLVLVEAPVTTWKTPTVKIDGVKMTDVKGQLTTEEARQYSGYEYVYKIDKPILDGSEGMKVDVLLEALSGTDPSTDPEVDFASAGRFLSTDGINTKVGAADDTSSTAVVFTVQDTAIDIS